jgi:hypothetical protein
VRRVLQLSIALSLTLVFDKAFNHGDITFKLSENGSEVTHWVAHASDRAAHSVSGF